MTKLRPHAPGSVFSQCRRLGSSFNPVLWPHAGVRARWPGAPSSPRLRFFLPFAVVGAWPLSWSHAPRSPGGHVCSRHSPVWRPVLSGVRSVDSQETAPGLPAALFPAPRRDLGSVTVLRLTVASGGWSRLPLRMGRGTPSAQLATYYLDQTEVLCVQKVARHGAGQVASCPRAPLAAP